MVKIISFAIIKLMKYSIKLLIITIASLLLMSNLAISDEVKGNNEFIELPLISVDSSEKFVSLQQAMKKRRSVRAFSDKSLDLEQLGQLLWSAQGITDLKGKRSVPSPGGLYPLEVYAVTGSGVYKYIPLGHKLELLQTDDLRVDLSAAAFSQLAVAEAGADIVICAVYERVTKQFGDRGVRFVHIEAGHAGQNIHLQAVGLGLGSISIGAFDDSSVKKLLSLPDEQQPVYIIPVGYRKLNI